MKVRYWSVRGLEQCLDTKEALRYQKLSLFSIYSVLYSLLVFPSLILTTTLRVFFCLFVFYRRENWCPRATELARDHSNKEAGNLSADNGRPSGVVRDERVQIPECKPPADHPV